MGGADARIVRNTALLILALVGLRLVAAAFTPITFDEAYYWMWSKNLAGGYYDHPPMVAYVIRAGTMIAGDTELGVRLVSILLALPMSYAVYRSAAILCSAARAWPRPAPSCST
ncbi:4-amino-4-deoxy-L-arabinose transferase-like glycosyltransferase [Bradyrhizobium liaoningense]